MSARPTLNDISIDASDSPIKSVKISKSHNAEVVRNFALKLKKGQNALEIKNLPSVIGAVRPSGLGAGVRIDDFLFVVERSEPSTGLFGLGNSFNGAPYSPRTPESLRALLAQEAALQSMRTIKEQENQLLLKYGQSLHGEHVSQASMAAFLESYVSHGQKAIQEVTKLNEDLVDIHRQIEAEKARLALKAGETRGQVKVIISADKDVETNFILTYIVNKCEWRSIYELHATTEDGKPSQNISLHYMALVSQSTGEDWTDAELTLSTIASDLAPKRLPRPAPLKIRPAAEAISTKENAPTIPPEASQLESERNYMNARRQNLKKPPFQSTGFSNVQPQYWEQEPPTTTSLFGKPGGGGGASTQEQSGAASNVTFTGGGLFPGRQGLFGISNAPLGTTTTFGGAPSGGSGGRGLFGQSVTVPATHTSSPFGSAQPAHPAGLFGGSGPAAPGATQGAPAGPTSFVQSTDEVADEEFQVINNEPESLSEPASVVHETPLSMVFVVNGTSSIPSDGLKHRVTLAVLPLKANLTYVTIPRDDPTVFLQCTVKNTSDYRLLTGTLSVIVDGSYISATMIENDINPGEEFECRLGADISTKVTYARSSKAVNIETSAFVEQTDTTLYTTKITVHNTHAFDIADLVVRDRIPTCDDKRVKVILHHPLDLGRLRDGAYANITDSGLKVGWEKLVDGKGGEKEGKFEWKWHVKSGEKVEFRAEHEVKVPRDAAWVVQAWKPLFGA